LFNLQHNYLKFITMGIQITNTSADYSSLGIGFSSFVDEFFSKAGVINETHKTAFRNMYNSLASAGLWHSGLQIFPYYGSTAATHKWVFTESVYELVETGSTLTHDAMGVTAAVNGYYVTNFIPPVDMSLGLAGGTNCVTAATQSGKFWAASGENTGGVANYTFQFGAILSTNYVASHRFGAITATGQTYSAHIMTIGFYQFSGIGSSQNILLGNTTVRAYSSAESPIGGGTRKMHLLAGMVDSSGFPGSTNYPNIKTNFQYVSSKGYTVAQMQSFNTIVSTFLTAIGR